MKPPNKAVVKVMKGLHFGLTTCGPVERRVIKKQTRRAVRRETNKMGGDAHRIGTDL